MLSQQGASYPSELSESQWSYIQDLIPKAKPGGRPRSYDERAIVSAILYLNRTGVAWRYLPKDFPPWQTVYRYFCDFAKNGVWNRLLNRLHYFERIRRNLNPTTPRDLILDSQSVRAQYGESLGYDGFKKIRGRKRHLLVDSLGLPFAIGITAANHQDASEGLVLLEKAREQMNLTALENVFVDGGYKTRVFFGTLIERYKVLPTLRSAEVSHIKGKREGRRLIDSGLKPTRWIVERTFAWLNNFRRLNRDYERKVLYSEAMLQAALIAIMLHRLVPHDF